MNPERLLNTFLDLVRIDSPTGHEAKVAAYCADALRACGCKVEFDEAGERIGSDTGNLVAILPGTLPGSVVLTAHMDCVQPCEGVKPVITDGLIHTDNTTVLGGDDKVGDASIIEALRTITESGEEHCTVKVVLSIQEEVGCCGAKSLSLPVFEQDEPTFVFDSEGAPGTADLGAPYHYTFKAEFTGKASHAGVAPEKGISAIEAASYAISQMRREGFMGAVAEHSASNIGTIQGGSANNVVAPSCKLTGECRSVDQQIVERIREGMTRCMEEGASTFGATVDIEWELEYPGFSLDEGARAVQIFEKAVRNAGLEPSTMVSAGGTDANAYVSYGAQPLVVGTGMTAFHSVDECLKVEDLDNTARIAVEIIRAGVLD